MSEDPDSERERNRLLKEKEKLSLAQQRLQQVLANDFDIANHEMVDADAEGLQVGTSAGAGSKVAPIIEVQENTLTRGTPYTPGPSSPLKRPFAATVEEDTEP